MPETYVHVQDKNRLWGEVGSLMTSSLCNFEGERILKIGQLFWSYGQEQNVLFLPTGYISKAVVIIFIISIIILNNKKITKSRKP